MRILLVLLILFISNCNKEKVEVPPYNPYAQSYKRFISAIPDASELQPEKRINLVSVQLMQTCAGAIRTDSDKLWTRILGNFDNTFASNILMAGFDNVTNVLIKKGYEIEFESFVFRHDYRTIIFKIKWNFEGEQNGRKIRPRKNGNYR